MPKHQTTIPRRRLGLWDRVLMRDVGLVKMMAGGRALVCLPAGMAAGYFVALAAGLPASVGLLLGALPAFLTCFVVVDTHARRVAARSAALYVPFALALFFSIALHSYRIVELVLIVFLLFAQFYAARFGVWASDFGAGLFAAYLCGLLLPLPLASFPDLALVFAGSLAAAIAVRWALFHPNALRSLMRSRRAFLAWESRVVEASVEALEEADDRSIKRLARRRAQAHEAALIADGMLAAPGSGSTGETAERLHQILFDTELAIDTLGRVADELVAAGAPAEVREGVAGALRVIAEHGGREGDRAARELLAWADGTPAVASDPRWLHSVHRAALLLSDVATSSDEWRNIRRDLPANGDGVPFESPVVLFGGRVLGAGPILNAEVTGGGMSGPWRRVKVSPALRVAIQAAIAVAITEPIAYAIDGQRFYWGVIGVMVVLAGTNSTHERLRKVGNRALGTIIGGVLGILFVALLGTDHVWWTLILVVVALTAGMYFFSRSYALWVIGLVVVLCQVYNYSGSFTDELILYRLAENVLGALVAVGVSAVVLPVATGVMIRRAVIRHLASVRAFVEAAAAGSVLETAAGSTARLRSASRAVDQATFQLEAVLKPLVRFPSGGGYRRDDATRTTLVAVASTIRSIAYRGERHAALSTVQASRLQEICSIMATSITALSEAVGATKAAPPAEGTAWVSTVTLITRLDALLVETDDDALLGYRLHALGRVDDALAGLAPAYGLTVDDTSAADTTSIALPSSSRFPELSAGAVRNRFSARR
ncbi:FUSC family protein [Frondihabitans cladoniiphilus]|uniref:Integral membrane bound transporter domain-containing protein n=1 Tax=Frondihabitans cladoniiphilus TaxID=715785 RepID=A0ABP8W583_9MICO